MTKQSAINVIGSLRIKLVSYKMLGGYTLYIRNAIHLLIFVLNKSLSVTNEAFDSSVKVPKSPKIWSVQFKQV